MGYFLGTWDFKGEAKPGPMGPGGPVTFRETCEMFQGGFALVCRSEGKDPRGTSKSLSIMTYDTEKAAYSYTGVGNDAPVFVATGKVDGGTWNWTTESKRGGQVMKTKLTIKEGGPTSYDFKVDMSINRKPFAPMMEGKLTRTGS